MPAYNGYEGVVKLDGVEVAQIKEWSIDSEAGTVDITAFGDRDRNFAHAIRNTVATITASMMSTDAEVDNVLNMASNTGTLDGLGVDLYLSTEAGRFAKYIGGARLTNVSQGAQVAGLISFTASLQFNNGAIYSTETAPELVELYPSESLYPSEKLYPYSYF